MKCAPFDSRECAALNSPKRAGVTLIEMSLVLTLIGILAAIGLPLLYPSVARAQLSTAASRIGGAINYARARAMLTGSPTRVVFDEAQDTVRVARKGRTIDPGKDLSGTLVFSFVESASYVVMEDPLNVGNDYLIHLNQGGWTGDVDLLMVKFADDSFVEFDARGIPSNGGSFMLDTGGELLRVAVDERSGRVTQ